MNKHHHSILTAFFFILFVAIFTCSCHDSNNDDPVESNNITARRTVLVYMAAHNSLSYFSASDSAEIMRGRQYLHNNDRMLMFIDNGTTPRLYRIARQWSKPELVHEWKEHICSASPNTLQAVLQLVKTTFPSQEYGLVMWSHADGWLPATDTNYSTTRTNGTRPFSFGIDTGNQPLMSNDGPQMDITDMAQAINNAGIHCKYILFDACLMQNIEVDYALRHVTDYVVASPMSIHSAGAYYTHQLRSGLFAQTPDSIALTYYNDVLAYADSLYDHVGIAISCTRTDKLEALAAAFKQALPYSKLMQHQSPDMSRVLCYQNYHARYYYRPHNYDARQAIDALWDEPYRSQLQQLLDQTIVVHYGTPSIYVGPGYNTFFALPTATDNFRAVSLFVPQEVYANNADRCRYGNLNECFSQTEWYKACGFNVTGW